jgi:hypothetical protein
MMHIARTDTAAEALIAIETEWRRTHAGVHALTFVATEHSLEERRHMRRVEAIEHVMANGKAFYPLAVKHQGVG